MPAKKKEITETYGALPTVADKRDRDVTGRAIKREFKKCLIKQAIEAKIPDIALPESVELNRNFFPPIDTQNGENRCVSDAITSVMTYTIRKARENCGIKIVKKATTEIEIKKQGPIFSSKFNWYTARQLLGNEKKTDCTKENLAVQLRHGLKAAKKFGVAREKEWPEKKDLSKEPTEHAYTEAEKFQISSYHRINPGSPKKMLHEILTHLGCNIPVIVTLPIYKKVGNREVTVSFNDQAIPDLRHKMKAAGVFPLPPMTKEKKLDKTKKAKAYHTVVAVGYNLSMKVPGSQYLGALFIRNSWGAEWGAGGYGVIPLEYILNKDRGTSAFAILNTEFDNVLAYKDQKAYHKELINTPLVQAML